MELQIHDKLETEIFYPAVREQAEKEESDLLDEAEVEHETMRELIQKIEDMGPTTTSAMRTSRCSRST